MAAKFKKNDQIIVISGSDKGKIGNIVSILNDKVIVGGINLATIHKKPTQNGAGEIIKKEASIHISNIAHVEDGKAIKVGFKVDATEEKKFSKKIRVSKKTGKKID